ncbi:MAG: hypothetical protein FH748_14495 [Balneolaceae bacterium]|nr:hypothetical protein [Balneolaceae bacterium]
MGRATIIIATGAILVLGILQMGMNTTRKSIAEGSASYANNVQVRNTAFTASQIAMERINESAGTWHPTEGSPWYEEIEGYNISLYYELLPTSASGAFSSLEEDTVIIHTVSYYLNSLTEQQDSVELINTYTKTALHFVPEFKSALSFATDDFTFSVGGSSSISGNPPSGSSCETKPAITVMDDGSLINDDYNEVTNADPSSTHFESDSTDVAIDPELTYSPVDELIARLSEMDGTISISGNYKGTMGSEESPGVFFVEEDAKLTGGISDGYGIMVVRSGGELAYDSSGVELDIAGNFTFNGLVVFEDAYELKGRGTPTINGSVLVGHTEDSSSGTINVDMSGNIALQYDCTAEKYAQLASANLLDQNRYKRLSTYE